MKNVTKEQMFEVMRQWRTGEADAERTQRFIENRTPAEAAAAHSLREQQARRLFDLELGSVLGCETFEQYLDAAGKDSFEPIPQVSAFPKEQVRLFGTQGIVLVDGRVIEKIGLTEYCKLVGLAYGGSDDTFEPFNPDQAKRGVRWMISQDGYRNRKRSVASCRESFASCEVGGDVAEGIAIWLQDPSVIEGHYLDLPGSVRHGARRSVAGLGVYDGRPELGWGWGAYADPQYGSVSRGE